MIAQYLLIEFHQNKFDCMKLEWRNLMKLYLYFSDYYLNMILIANSMKNIKHLHKNFLYCFEMLIQLLKCYKNQAHQYIKLLHYNLHGFAKK